ncbi:hypothetical protein Acor_10850 [Acrocarpospora corrugata]|uniref:Uncharacterized protein n=1 Tax=Acrocarpospora corrugata TaxID=35763 RepID=A0A5M3VTL6_9ACTN|nr:hypothetical protein [Acrocarpospora corrugata]GER99021.1 hypothetical protein Acor_10850 [Acrocarpospora corrugata]
MILVSAALVLAAIVLLIAGVVLAQPFLVMWSIVVSVLSAVCLLIGALLRRHELFPAGGRSQAATPQPVPNQLPPQPMHQQPMTQSSPQMAHAGGPGYGGVPQQQMTQQMVNPMANPMANPMMAAPVPGPVAAPMPSAATQQVAFPGSGAQDQERRSRPPIPRPLPGGGLGPDSIVLVIPGRKRFHLPNCRQLADREIEELTLEEAREEGFSPCTACVTEGLAPVEPAETAPGRAGSAASARSIADTPTVSASVPSPPSRPSSSPSPSSSEAADPSRFGAETADSGRFSAEAADSGRFGSEAVNSSRFGAEAVNPTVAVPLPSAPPVPVVPTLPPASSEWSAFSRPTATPTQVPTPPAPDPEPAKPEPVVAESAAVKEKEKPEPAGRPEPADATVEATRPVPANDESRDRGSSRDESRNDSRSDGGSDAKADSGETAGDDDVVHVLVGTRRYHRADCSLVGDDGTGIETMTKAEAEAAGLTQCSACADR